MKKTYKQIPFDIELAKKIQSGEVEGRIVTNENLLVRIVDFNLKDKTDSIVYIGTYANGKQEFIQTCNNEGKSFGVNVLYIELPEETPKHDSFNKKLHDTAEVLATPKHEFKVGDKVAYAGIMGYITNINKNLLVDIDPVICGIFHNVNISEIKFIDDSSTDKPKHEFKSFDKVLVKSGDNTEWCAAIYSHYSPTDTFHYIASGCHWKYCIPYEGNEHLVGTTNNPE